jgi:hypothetical protein
VPCGERPKWGVLCLSALVRGNRWRQHVSPCISINCQVDPSREQHTCYACWRSGPKLEMRGMTLEHIGI